MARIEKIEYDLYGVWTPFEYKDDLKAIPTARWNPTLRCWTIHEMFLDEAERLVRRVNGETGNPETPEGYNELTMALEDLFDALPTNLRRATHRALATVWHPDKGGNTDAMKALNTARKGKET